jgi:hypothetical protein
LYSRGFLADLFRYFFFVGSLTKSLQRMKKKNPLKYGKLSEEQIAAMESLGFVWNVWG